MKEKISSFIHTETFDIYIQEVLKRMHKCYPTVRNMCILFYEQTVYGTGTQIKKRKFQWHSG